jgi:hypothetical protein
MRAHDYNCNCSLCGIRDEKQNRAEKQDRIDAQQGSDDGQ